MKSIKKTKRNNRTLADAIVLGKVIGFPITEMVCSEHCPFFRFNHGRGTESNMVCSLPPGETEIDMYPWWNPESTVRYENRGHNMVGHRRVANCLDVKPLSLEAEKAWSASSKNEKQKMKVK